jgi:hypothetical protein
MLVVRKIDDDICNENVLMDGETMVLSYLAVSGDLLIHGCKRPISASYHVAVQSLEGYHVTLFGSLSHNWSALTA